MILRDTGGSNPLPPMCSRLTGCAGYILIPETIVGFDFLSDVSFFSYASLIVYVTQCAVLYSLRLSHIGTCAMF